MRPFGALSLFFFAWIAKTETNHRKSVSQTAIAKGLIFKPDLFFAFWSSFCRFFSRLAISLLKFGFLGAHVSALCSRAHKAARELVHFFNSTLDFQFYSNYFRAKRSTDRQTDMAGHVYMGNNFLLLPPHLQTNNVPPALTIYHWRNGEHHRFKKMTLCSTLRTCTKRI